MAGRFSVEAVFKAVDRVTTPVSRMQRSVEKFTKRTEANFRKLDGTVDKFTRGLRSAAEVTIKAAAAGVGILTASVGLLVREFSKVENAEAAFTPLLGGAEKAKQAVQALNETAASTPFQFETLASATNQLLPVMDGNIQNTIKTLRMLGDTAGGNAQKLDSITRGFTKAMLKGKVDMESLNMIAEAGVPIFGDLADVMGTEVNDSFFKMISAGKVTTAQLTKAFEKMTSKGGKFFNGMEIASRTTSGLMSTLKDNVSLTAAEIGSVLAPTIKDLLKNTITIAGRVREWVKENRKLINKRFLQFIELAKNSIAKLSEAFKNLVESGKLLNGIKTAVSALGTAFEFLSEHAESIAMIIGAIVILSTVLKTLIVIMTAVNLIMAANPMVLITLAVIALIAALSAAVIWWDNLKAAIVNASAPIKLLIGTVAALVAGLGAYAAVMAAVNLVMLANPIGLMIAGVTALIAAVVTLVRWASKLASVRSFFGFGDDEEPIDLEGEKAALAAADARTQPQVVSPQDRVARTIEEQRTTKTAEVTIKDESGRAEVTGGTLGAGLTLQSTGAF